MTAAEIELPKPEQDRLNELEDVVERGLATFVDVGRALSEINSARLYRATHSTFAEYAADRFGIGKSHAYRMISAAKVAEAVSPIGDIRSEAQARELSGLPDNIAQAAFDIAKGVSTLLRGDAQPTANEIAEARRRVEGRPIRLVTPTAPEAARARTDEIRDLADQIMADELADDEREPSSRLTDLRVDENTGEIYDVNGGPPAPKPEPRKLKRKPITDAAQSAGWDIRKAAERIERIVTDDRFANNKEQVTTALRGHLLFVADAVAAALDQMP